jgi:hypothetical protein
MTPCNDPG